MLLKNKWPESRKFSRTRPKLQVLTIGTDARTKGSRTARVEGGEGRGEGEQSGASNDGRAGDHPPDLQDELSCTQRPSRRTRSVGARVVGADGWGPDGAHPSLPLRGPHPSGPKGARVGPAAEGSRVGGVQQWVSRGGGVPAEWFPRRGV